MRASEIMENQGPVHDLMLKLRKGAAASLNASKLQQVFAVLGSGWKIEKTNTYKLSDGGYSGSLLDGIETGLRSFVNYKKRNSGRIDLHTGVPRDVDQYAGYGKTEEEKRKQQEAYRNKDASKLAELQAAAKKLKALETAPEKGKWFVRDVQFGTAPAVYGNGEDFHLSFELYVLCSTFVITSPDGQTYEVFGDHKNGAIGAQNFQTWFAWAVENTDIMDEILNVLGMEPHEKKHDPRAAYKPPESSSAELKRVFEFLKEMSDGVRAEQKANLVSSWKKALMNFDDAVNAGDRDRVRAMADGYNGYIISRCYSVRDKRLNDDWEAEVERQAEGAVEEMQNMFVYKNTRKLAPILEGKGGNETKKIVSINAEGGIITAVLDFSWDDGSEFRVQQSIVMSYSGRGTPFYRFPTTFHDVKLPGGVKMGMPSEERMNEIFAKATQE